MPKVPRQLRGRCLEAGDVASTRPCLPGLSILVVIGVRDKRFGLAAPPDRRAVGVNVHEPIDHGADVNHGEGPPLRNATTAGKRAGLRKRKSRRVPFLEPWARHVGKAMPLLSMSQWSVAHVPEVTFVQGGGHLVEVVGSAIEVD
jgi:hypothetical protein